MKSTVEGRLLVINWCFLAVLAVILLVVLAATDFAVRASDPIVIISIGLAVVLGPLSSILLRTGSARWPSLSHAANVLAQLMVLALLVLPLSYAAASPDYRLQDDILYALDHLLGLEWKSYLNFITKYDLGVVSRLGYSTILWEPFPIPMILCLSSLAARCHQFSLAYMLAAAITIAMSIFVPALGTYSYLGLTPADYPNIDASGASLHAQGLLAVRIGGMRLLELSQLHGIVMFPSFHAASAIIYLWALWAVWWTRPVALVCNALLVLSTPIDGGHYFIDVFAGVALALLCIWITRVLANAIRIRLILKPVE